MTTKSIRIVVLHGTTKANKLYIGPQGSITVDDEKKQIRIHDGVTPGGHVLTAESTTGLLQTYETFGNFPAIGDKDVLYIAIDTAQSYRWSEGGSYIEVNRIPTDSDGLKEGNTNRFFTDDRAKAAARHAFSSNDLEINTDTGEIKVKQSANGLPAATEQEVLEGKRDDVAVTPKQLHAFANALGFHQRDNGVWDFGKSN